MFTPQNRTVISTNKTEAAELHLTSCQLDTLRSRFVLRRYFIPEPRVFVGMGVTVSDRFSIKRASYFM